MSTPHQAQTADYRDIAKRVLVIDKGKAHHNALAHIAGRHGWEFQCAEGLEEAGHHPGPETPYVHFVDSAYRETEIKKYVTRLRQHDTAYTVLALCDDSTRSRALSLLRHGVYDWIQKPFDPEELIHVLERTHERVRLAKENEFRHREQKALEGALNAVVRSAKKIARHHSLVDYCRALMQELAELFGADGGSIYLVEGEKLVRVHSLDPGHAAEEIPLPPAADSFLGLAHRTGRPVLVNDTEAEGLAVPSGFPAYRRGSCLVLPVFHNGEELVAFVSLHDRRSSAFTAHDSRVGAALTSVSAGFLRALRTLSESRQRESRYEHFFKEGLTINFIAREDGRIDLANPAFYRTLCPGKTPDAELTVTDFFSDRTQWKHLVAQLKTTGQIDHIETEMTACDGGRRVLFGNLIANPDKRGGVASVSAAFFDVTQKKELERELNHSLKMEAIGRLAGGVAHDFNNLITAVLGYCDVLKGRVTDAETLEEIDGIRHVGEKASLLTRQLLALTRKQARVNEPVALGRLVGELDRLLMRVIGEGITLTSLVSAPQALIIADRGQLEQVIMNLVVNARDALPRGGEITVAVDEEEVPAVPGESAEPGTYVVLRVRDTGTGMDEETQRHLFEPFFSTKGSDKGTGLGLSTVYAIVQQAGGFIKVDSVPGKGSTFALSFPKADVADPLPSLDENVAPPAPGSERILIVDDERVVRVIMTRILSKYGYQVCEAADGDQALALAASQAEPFACAVIDMVMPSISGIDLAHRLRETQPDLKVLFVSGYAPEEIGNHGGADINPADLITKPFEADELARKLREIIERGKRA